MKISVFKDGLRHFLQATRQSVGLLWPVLRRNPLLFIAAFFSSEFLQHYFQTLIRLSQQTASLNIPALLGSLLTSLALMTILILAVPFRIMEIDQHRPPGHLWPFARHHFVQLSLESIRALAVTLLWLLAFLIPGIFKYIRYTFVPYVVIADPMYDKGHRDALDYSNQLMKGLTFWMLLLMLVMLGAFSVQDALREALPLMTKPILSIAIGFLFFLFNLYTNILQFRLYQIRAKALQGV